MDPILRQIIEERIAERRFAAEIFAQQHLDYLDAASTAQSQADDASADVTRLQAALDAELGGS